MKIAFVSTRGIPNNYGGFEQFAEYISVGMAQRGHEVVVYSPKFHPYQESTYKGVRIKHIYSPETWMGSSVGSFFYDFASLRDALKKEDFDIIYEAGYTSIIPAYIWFNVKKRKRPIFTTNMDGLENKRSKFSPMVRRFLDWEEKMAVKYSHYLIADNMGIHDYYKEKYGKESKFLAYGADIHDDFKAEYLQDGKVPVKYVVCTGAFAQGLQEYETLMSPGAKIPLASATKMALGIHPDLKVGSNVLVLARQRIIDDINGKTGPKMLQLLAQQGATVVMSPGDKKIADFKVVPMQDSGHIKNGEMREYYHKIAKLAPEAAFISIHGSEAQLNNTRRVIREEGGVCHVFANSDVIRVGGGLTEARENERVPQEWIGAARIYHNPLKLDDGIPNAGILEYYRIDDNFVKLAEEPIFRDAMFAVRASRPGDRNYYANHPEIRDGNASYGVMVNPYTGKPVKTKSGKPRKENPLKNKQRNKGNGRGFGGEGR